MPNLFAISSVERLSLPARRAGGSSDSSFGCRGAGLVRLLVSVILVRVTSRARLHNRALAKPCISRW